MVPTSIGILVRAQRSRRDLARINTVMFGEPKGVTRSAEASYVPMFTHLALVFMAGVYLPAALVAGFQNVARLLG